jgi:hypothetical protein
VVASPTSPTSITMESTDLKMTRRDCPAYFHKSRHMSGHGTVTELDDQSVVTQNLAGPGIEPGSPHLYRGALLPFLSRVWIPYSNTSLKQHSGLHLGTSFSTQGPITCLTQNLAGPGIEPRSPHLYQGALPLGHPAHSCPECGFHIPTQSSP